MSKIIFVDRGHLDLDQGTAARETPQYLVKR